MKRGIHVGDKRNLLFATNTQLDALATAKTWYMDGTFMIVRAPFKQFFRIHAFVRSEDDVKQIPLAFVEMSWRKTVDYEEAS